MAQVHSSKLVTQDFRQILYTFTWGTKSPPSPEDPDFALQATEQMVFLRGYAKKLMKDALKTETLRQVVQNISKHAKNREPGTGEGCYASHLVFCSIPNVPGRNAATNEM